MIGFISQAGANQLLWALPFSDKYENYSQTMHLSKHINVLCSLDYIAWISLNDSQNYTKDAKHMLLTVLNIYAACMHMLLKDKPRSL